MLRGAMGTSTDHGNDFVKLFPGRQHEGFGSLPLEFKLSGRISVNHRATRANF
jgi:hypothetical protein